MSLFPAYSTSKEPPKNSNQDANEETSQVAGASSWLENPSFSVDIPQIPRKTDLEFPGFVERIESSNFLEEKKNEVNENSLKEEDSPYDYRRKKSSKRKKNKNHHEHRRKKHEHGEDASVLKEGKNYYEDKVCEKGNLMVSTLSRPAVPLYDRLHGCSVGEVKWRKTSKRKQHQQRYYTHLHKFCEVQSVRTEDVSPKLNELTQRDTKENEDVFVEMTPDNRLEEELSKKTAHFNKSLSEEPNNLELWLEYARFQDAVWQFEKNYRRGGGAKGARVTAERKLAILDKALQHNPDSEILLKEKIYISESVYPADTLSQQLGDMLEKQPSKLALWHGYIGATQCSLALCTVPAVLKLYTQAMERLHQFRRGAPAAQTKPTEEKILALFYDCGIFLRQAGLWEQLWLLIRLHLELNISHLSNQFKIDFSVPENLVIEKEEQILASGLPLSEIWLRVEQLREGVHWLPWMSDEDCEDTQRVVFSDDVSDLIHPLTTPSLVPNIAAVALILIKVPILPYRDTALHVITPQMKSWSLDSVEMLLPALFPVGTVDLDCAGFFKDITKLSVGPQYLEQRIGQEHYLQFVMKVFNLCIDCMKGSARTAFCVWWLRFERYLVILDKFSLCSLSQTRKKKLKSMIKEFLKQDQNRNCLLFYREYALLEWELGHYDGACKILQTAISAQPSSVPVVSVINEEEKMGLGSLYRTLCELYLRRSRLPGENSSLNKQKAISVLMALALGKPISSIDTSSPPQLEQLVAASEKFQHIGIELKQDIISGSVMSVTDLFLPDFFVDWISCNAWFLFLTHSTWAAGAALENILEKMPVSSGSEHTAVSKMSCCREALFETYVNLFYHHCIENAGTYSVLRDLLQRAISEFPNNLYFLSTAVKLQGGADGIGCPWWKMRQYFSKTDSVMPQIFLLFFARQRFTQKENLSAVTHSYLNIAGPIVPDSGMENLLGALFRHLEEQTLTKHCPLIWRLYLRFLYDHGSADACKTAFYRAIGECPWVRALYIDACRLISEELPQIRDLIIEKEMRLHVTPEELDILRSGPS